MVFRCLGSNVAEDCDTGIVLFEIRKILKQGLDTLRREEDQHIVEDIPEIRQVAGDGLVHDRGFKIEILLLEVIDDILLAKI